MTKPAAPPKQKLRSLLKIKPRRPYQSDATLPLPPDTAIVKLSAILEKQWQKEERRAKYAPVKQVLSLLGRGAVLSAAILAPKSAPALLPLITESPDWNAWKHYNASYLKRTLKRLEKQKMVEVSLVDNEPVVTLTSYGKRKILRYSTETLTIDKPKHWDGKWRLVLYDIPKDENTTRDLFREALKSMGFYQIQESVYLIPHNCFDQIEFLRQYYFVNIKVQYMVVSHIENDTAYRTYFGLDSK